MWQCMIERLMPAGGGGQAVFWSDLTPEVEQAMLHQLFASAVEGNVLTGDQIARFLSDVLAMQAPGIRGQPSTPAQPPFDLEAATRSLLSMDEKLSPLCSELFGRRLLSDQERETLTQDLGASRKPVRRQRTSCGMH